MTVFLQKTQPGSPIPEYDAFLPVWKKARAVIGGAQTAKEHDQYLDLFNFSNLLVPFSPTMSPEQYKWYLAEAEFPGITAQYARVLLGGLLRKPPSIELPDSVPEEARDWLYSEITEDSRPMLALLDDAVFEEFTTSRCIVAVDFPNVSSEAYQKMLPEERAKLKPYPIIWKAEDVINWRVVTNEFGRPTLDKIVFRFIDKSYEENDFHPKYYPTIVEHYLDNGVYTIQYYQNPSDVPITVRSGEVVYGTDYNYGEIEWIPVGDPIIPKIQGNPLSEIPVFPLNGEWKLQTPILMPIIDKEVALYNKLSRRNHLLYGASTYTPVIFSNMSDEDFRSIISRGLGSWIKLDPQDRIDVFRTPVEALADLDRAIVQNTTELASLGTKLLNPDYAESGVAMQIRNSPQTAQLGSLNAKISAVMQKILALMIYWRYGIDVPATEIRFTLSEDFTPGAVTADSALMITDWYQNQLIPRSVWLESMKRLELLPSDYDDEEGVKEIGQDPVTIARQTGEFE